MITQDHPLLSGLVNSGSRPCLSLYVPVHRTQPERRDDLPKFRVMLKHLESSLKRAYGKADIAELMKPFYALLDDETFWNMRKEGIAVFAAPTFSAAYHLERPVPEIAIVANSFHLKPLIRVLQTLDAYHILGINRERISFYFGDRDGIREVDLPRSVPRTIVEALGELEYEQQHTLANSGGATYVHAHSDVQNEIEKDTERFFRVIDQAVMEAFSRPSGLPLILAGLPEQLSVFHKISKNPNVLLESVTSHPDGISRDELSARAWSIMEPYKVAELRSLIEQFFAALAAGKASDDPVSVAKAAAEGRVDALIVEAGRQIPGMVDESTGSVQFDDLNQPDVDDLLDDVAELVLKMKGRVGVLATENMPSTTGIAAIFRY